MKKRRIALLCITYLSIVLLGMTVPVMAKDMLQIQEPTDDLAPYEEPQAAITDVWEAGKEDLDTEQGTDASDTPVYTRSTDVYDAIRQALLNREETLILSVGGEVLDGVTTENIKDCAMGIVEEAAKHITCGEPGSDARLRDYYDKTSGAWQVDISYAYSGTQVTQATYTYTFSFYTCKEQEDYVTQRLSGEVYPALKLSDPGLTDAQKICRIYTWITTNVSYDYENLNDDSNLTKYTAYGALHDGKAVCQGFAGLVYRICMDNGIDCRIVTGTANGGDHAWNMAQVDGVYYLLDATWDCKVVADGTRSEQANKYIYFLRSSLPDHTEDTKEAVTSGYNMADHSISAIAAVINTEGKKTLTSSDVTLQDICGNVLTDAQKIWFKVAVTKDEENVCTWHIKVSCSAIGKEDLVFADDTKYMHMDPDNDGKCNTCDLFLDGIGAHLAGYTLSLNGNIGVNFYMELTDDVASDESAYMSFTLPNGAISKVYTCGTHEDGITAQKASVSLDGAEKEYYVFACEVAAKEMTADIRAQIVADHGGKKGTVYTYTVKAYADYILSHAEEYGSNVSNLVNAMLNYGGFAQEYFGYKTNDLANKDLTEDEKAAVINTVNASGLSGMKAKVENAADVCTFVSAYLSLKSCTDLCVYVKLAEGVSLSDVTFMVDGMVLDQNLLKMEKVNGSDCYRIVIQNITADQLGKLHTFAVRAGSGENTKNATLQYGAFSYIYAVLSDADDTIANAEKLRNTVKAMYLYGNAACIYKEAGL